MFSDVTSTGFMEAAGTCEAGNIGNGNPNTTLVITSISDTRVVGAVKTGSIEQSFDLPICASQVAYCGCVP